ncbi:MAG TPA: sigma-70 family RNA polymerase sigma factor [Actinomycetota bacterium]|nr:sigma-70 family RNA polymerase sigma factor [Actinomycetota bacterium]
MPDARTDAELLLASRNEPSAFVEVYRRHAEALLRYVGGRVLDPEVAAELTAETFAEAFASRGSYRDTGADGVAWIYGIAKHQLGRYFRRGRVDTEARRKLAMPVRALPDEDFERIEELIDLAPIRAALVEALGTLDADQRRALELRVVDGLPYPEVAAKLSCGEPAARQRVSRGLRKLALLLQERGLQPATEVSS